MISEHENRIWRLTPRRNDEVNDTWMCDWGRLNYRFVGDGERLRTPLVRGEQGLAAQQWDHALTLAAEAIDALRHRFGPGALGAVVSPHLTNEENFRFGQLLDSLGVKHVAMAVRRGKADNLLIKAEKAANARGVRELGLVSGEDDGLESLLDAAKQGEVRGLYVCGDDLLDVVAHERVSKILAGLELLIVQTIRMRPELAAAEVVLPSTTFAEKEGTFTNHAGRIQRLYRAIETPPGWLADGEIFTRLLNRLAARSERFELGEIWRAMTADGTAFASVVFDQVGPLGVPLPTTAQ